MRTCSWSTSFQFQRIEGRRGSCEARQGRTRASANPVPRDKCRRVRPVRQGQYCLHLALDTSPQSTPGGDARKPGCCTAIVAPEALRTNHPPPLIVRSFCTFAARTRLGRTFQGRLHKIPWHHKRLDDLGCNPPPAAKTRPTFLLGRTLSFILSNSHHLSLAIWLPHDRCNLAHKQNYSVSLKRLNRIPLFRRQATTQNHPHRTHGRGKQLPRAPDEVFGPRIPRTYVQSYNCISLL